MYFNRFSPQSSLERIIECYWIAEDSNVLPRKEKIIPDGFTELIFHYRDPYRICLNDSWQLQANCLLAGQIDRHFFLENTGASGMIGIKLKPASLTHLYGLEMSNYTNKVIDANAALGKTVERIRDAVQSLTYTHEEKVNELNRYFSEFIATKGIEETPIDRGIDMILSNHGMVTIASVCERAGVGERQLENLFRKYVGLSPKLYARIIRFGYIFQLVNEKEQNWSDLAYEAAFYDQSHFIRNFKNFTGENPADYAFNERNLANFFLRKKKL